MSQQDIVLITGANTGLGFQMVRALCGSDKPYSILLGGRSTEKVQQAVKSATEEFPDTKSKITPIQIDIESDESIQKAFDKVKSDFGRLDALVNNAGAQLDQQIRDGAMTMREAWNKSWDVNVAGTQVTTATFAPLLLASANPRLLFMASGTSSLAGTTDAAMFFNKSPAAGWPKAALGLGAYRSSKTGMNMMMREWHRLLGGDGVKVWCISPGFLATGLGDGQEANKGMGAGDPQLGGTFVRDVLEGKRDADVGLCILSDKVQPW